MDKSELERLVDLTIDAMAELHEAEQKIDGARKKIETVSNILFSIWKNA